LLPLFADIGCSLSAYRLGLRGVRRQHDRLDQLQLSAHGWAASEKSCSNNAALAYASLAAHTTMSGPISPCSNGATKIPSARPRSFAQAEIGTG